MVVPPPYLTGIIALLVFGAFVKIVTALSILRIGLGLRGAGFGLVVLIVSLVLSILAIAPDFPGQDPWQFLLGSKTVDVDEDFLGKIRPFMVRHTDSEVAERIAGLAEKLSRHEGDEGAAEPGDGPEVVEKEMSLSSLAAAFLLSELREAFQIGFIILLPFFVLDILILNVLLSMGITQISAQLAALPVKLMLFFAVDGWTLITEKLLGSYMQ